MDYTEPDARKRRMAGKITKRLPPGLFTGESADWDEDRKKAVARTIANMSLREAKERGIPLKDVRAARLWYTGSTKGGKVGPGATLLKKRIVARQSGGAPGVGQGGRGGTTPLETKDTQPPEQTTEEPQQTEATKLGAARAARRGRSSGRSSPAALPGEPGSAEFAKAARDRETQRVEDSVRRANEEARARMGNPLGYARGGEASISAPVKEVADWLANPRTATQKRLAERERMKLANASVRQAKQAAAKANKAQAELAKYGYKPDKSYKRKKNAKGSQIGGGR